MPKEKELLPKVVVVWPGPEVNVRGLEAVSPKRGDSSLPVGMEIVEIAQQGTANRIVAKADTAAKGDLRSMGHLILSPPTNRTLRNHGSQLK
jgi:hypothetical protein